MKIKDQIAKELAGIVGEDGVVIDPDDLRVYETDGLTVFKARPEIVVLPYLAEQVARVVKVCWLSESISNIRFIRLSPIRTPPSNGRAPPERPVPAPLATKGIFSRQQTFTTLATCSAK